MDTEMRPIYASGHICVLMESPRESEKIYLLCFFSLQVLGFYELFFFFSRPIQSPALISGVESFLCLCLFPSLSIYYQSE